MISMREAYEKIGANYDDACARLMGEEMLARFALKFLDDEVRSPHGNRRGCGS